MTYNTNTNSEGVFVRRQLLAAPKDLAFAQC